MAEDKVPRGKKEYNAETLTDLLQKYTEGLKALNHFTSNLEDGSNETVKDIRAVIVHLLELGEDMKDSFTYQTEINDTWRNLGHILKSGLKLINKLLKKIKPDPVQELSLIEISNSICYVLCCNREPLERHRDEVDARIEAIDINTTRLKEEDSKPSISKDFFMKHKWALETRLPILGPILNQLEQVKVLNSTERDEIQSKSTDAKKNESLLKILERKGAEAQDVFCKVLQKEDPFLVENLEKSS